MQNITLILEAFDRITIMLERLEHAPMASVTLIALIAILVMGLLAYTVVNRATDKK